MSYPIKESSVYLRHIADLYSRRDSARMWGRDIFCEWPKLELEKRGEGSRALDMERVERSLRMINTRVDCADFVLPVFLTILSRYGDSKLISDADRERFKQAVLGYKYAMDDPNEDINGVCYFTENHQALFAACEYIAGQIYPNETFTNNKQKGAWHHERGGQRIAQWIDWRARFGYSEWLSNTYYGEDLLALVLVCGLGHDIPLVKKAGMLIELTLFDIAVNAYNGTLAATNGRAYTVPTLRPDTSAVSPVCKLYWGEGSYDELSLGAVALAAFDYQCSAAVKNIGLDRSRYINRERMSIDVEESAEFGLDPKNYDDIMFYWGQQTFLHRAVIENSMKLCPEWLGMRPSIDAHWEKFQLIEKAGGTIDPDLECCALTRTDIYTYKSPYFSLSTSQDFRKAKVGYQQHIWEACMGGRAVIFSNCPGSADYTDRPNQIAGNSFMPRAVQHENVVLCVHRVPTESAHFFFTHLYFPQSEFDEVREEGLWIFGKRGGAYIAVYSSIKGAWRRPDINLYRILYQDRADEEFKFAKPWEYNVPKHAVVYVCEMGDEEKNGSFDNFIAGFKGAAFSGDTFAFTYQSPSVGKMSFGWDEPLKVKDAEVGIHAYKRYDNPFCQAEFGKKVYEIQGGGEKIVLDFDN
ncbi:hypothetical protein FACS1894151_07320 [Spirochaetia bacterium]|nr:hypothetical protein FACS1894151_07320 [Spirochaetia bacterium]